MRFPRFDGHELGLNKGLNHDEEKETGATPRQYDAAFKDEAVGMWLAELGVLALPGIVRTF